MTDMGAFMIATGIFWGCLTVGASLAGVAKAIRSLKETDD